MDEARGWIAHQRFHPHLHRGLAVIATDRLCTDVRTFQTNPALAYLVNQFFVTANGGTSWTAIPLPGGDIGGQGFYNLNVSVDPTTPDIVYLCGVELWKATRSGATGRSRRLAGALIRIATPLRLTRPITW